jgi:uncharacterized Tic20 family protein
MSNYSGVGYAADDTTTDDERTWAMAAHLGTMLGSAVPLGGILAPLVVWLIHRDKSDFVADHAKESLAFQIGITLAAVALAVIGIFSGSFAGLAFALLGVLALVVAAFVYMILATIRANKGQYFQYPVTTRFVS